MTERKWTPGEWEIEDGSKSCHCCFNKSIYVKTGPGSWEYEPIAEMLSENEGDVHLLRASKDLYEALACQDPFNEGVNNGNPNKKDGESSQEFGERIARAALAKARGET